MKIFFDFDGTLAEFRKDAGPDEWAAPGYARKLRRISSSLLCAIDKLARTCDLRGEKIELYLLSAVVSMDYAVEDKKWWIRHEQVPIPEENMIFVQYGQSKAQVIRDRGIEINEGDLFIDDYTKNLEDMCELMTCVKMLNGINDTHGSWDGSRISAFSSAKTIVNDLMGISYAAKPGQAA